MNRASLFRSNGFKVCVFVVGAVVLGALLSPPLFWAGKKVVALGWLAGGPFDSLHGSMDRATFSRYFNRALLLGALLLLGPVLRWMRAGEEGGTGDGGADERSGRGGRGAVFRARLGLERNRLWWRDLVVGFLLAGGSLLLLGWFYVDRGWYGPRGTDESLPGLLLGALGTGMAVAFLEEFLFRGALHAVMARILKPVVLWLAIAAFFALVHFLHPPHGLVIEKVGPLAGFWMLGQIFGQLGDPYFLAAEFAVLFAIGLALGHVRMKTASLWLAIGLHAGWVFGVKTLSPLTERQFGRAEMMPWLGDTLRVGLVSCVMVLLTWGLLWLCWLRRIDRRAFASAGESLGATAANPAGTDEAAEPRPGRKLEEPEG